MVIIMKKWKTVLLVLFSVTLFCVACGKVQDAESEVSVMNGIEVQSAEMEVLGASQANATIYYSSGSFDGLMREKIELQKDAPDDLVSALARHNIVPFDTKVNSFELIESDGTNQIVLDLSKSFSTYLSTMSDECETLIIASLTNTMLDTYQADSLCITVDGDVLSTRNRTYEEPISGYDFPIMEVVQN